MKKIAEYRYANTISTYDLPPNDKPMRTDITLSYTGKKPKEISILRIMETETKLFGGYDVEYDDENKTIHISYDIVPNNHKYIMQVKPADNEVINMDIVKSESLINVNGDVTSEVNDKGQTIVTITNYSKKDTLKINMTVENTGRSFSKPLDSVEVLPKKSVKLNVNWLARDYDQASSLTMNVVDKDDNEKQAIHNVYSLK